MAGQRGTGIQPEGLVLTEERKLRQMAMERFLYAELLYTQEEHFSALTKPLCVSLARTEGREKLPDQGQGR